MSIGGPPGPGWWQATDGRWYAPEVHPANQPPAQQPYAPGPGYPPGQPYPPGPGYPPGYGYAPPAPKKMPAWAIGLLCSVVGFFVLSFLMAVAIPTFIGVRQSANLAPDRAAESNLNVALSYAKSVYAAHGIFPADTLNQLGRDDSVQQFVSATTPTTSPETVSAATVPHAILMTNRSESGTCWWILVVDSPSSGTGPGLPTAPGNYYDRSTGASCQASAYPTTGWRTNGYPPT